MVHLIDRRLNDRGKSAVNRERFLRRYKTHVQDAVQEHGRRARSIDMSRAAKSGCRQGHLRARLQLRPGGDRESVLPGNREYVTGDRIPRPEGGGRRRRRQREGGDGRQPGRLRVLAVARRVHADLLRRPRAAAPAAHRVRPSAAQEHPRGLRQERRADQPRRAAHHDARRSRGASRSAARWRARRWDCKKHVRDWRGASAMPSSPRIACRSSIAWSGGSTRTAVPRRSRPALSATASCGRSRSRARSCSA